MIILKSSIPVGVDCFVLFEFYIKLDFSNIFFVNSNICLYVLCAD